MSEKRHESDVSFIKALAELLRENDLTELRVKRDYADNDSLDVRVSRGGPPPQIMTAASAPATAPVASASPVAASTSADAPAESGSDADTVPSPMVGTVYLSPEPGSNPFVRPGDSVEEGDTLLIVEAMKTMNHIPAPRSGTIRQVLVQDGAPVEFGAPLVILS